MDRMVTHLNIMLDGLKKKEQALAEILSITENQQTVIKSELPLDAIRELVFEMNEGKQAAIKIVKDCDNMFEAMLKDMGQDLEARQDMYTPQVKTLQLHIRRVMDLDVKIRVTEDDNNRLLDERRSGSAQSQPQVPSPGQKTNRAPEPKPKVNMPTNSVQVIKAYEKGRTNYKG